MGWSAQAATVFKVQGVDPPLKYTLLEVLSAQEDTQAPIEEQALQGEENLRRKLRLLGYYQPDIQSTWTERKGQWILVYRIAPNAQTIITAVDFILLGAPQPALAKTIAPLLPMNGSPFIDPLYETCKKEILSQVIGMGFLDATFTVHQVNVDIDQHTAEIHLHLSSGPLYTIGQIRFLAPYFRPTLLDRYVHIQRQDGYNSKEVLALQSTLMGSNYFKKVAIQPVRKDSTTIDLEITTELQAPNHSLVGFGYGTDTGLRGRLGWERRYINRWGHRFQAQAYLAERYQSWSLDYMVPGHYPPTDQYHGTASQTHEDVDHQQSTTKTFGVKAVSHIGHWKRTLQLDYYTEMFQAYLGALNTRSNLILPAIYLTRIISDNPIYPQRGYRFDFRVRGSLDTFLSSARFIQFYGKIKAVYPVFTGDFIARIEAGTLSNQNAAIPLSLRFFAGGDHSIRGYAYRSLGPTTIDNRGRPSVIGGRHLLVGSAEYNHLLYKDLGAAVFIDMGNAMNTWSTPLRTGAGIGAYWKTPLGPLRLDIAHPFKNTHVHYRDMRFHLSLGPTL